jgi:hypothetical protein
MRLIASLPNGARLELEDLGERALSAMIEVLGRCNAKYACRNCERTDISTPVIIMKPPLSFVCRPHLPVVVEGAMVDRRPRRLGDKVRIEFQGGRPSLNGQCIERLLLVN